MRLTHGDNQGLILIAHSRDKACLRQVHMKMTSAVTLEFRV